MSEKILESGFKVQHAVEKLVAVQSRVPKLGFCANTCILYRCGKIWAYFAFRISMELEPALPSAE